MTRRLTNEEVENYIELHGYKLFSQYVSSVKYIKVQCNVGHTYETRFPTFKRGSRCPVCAMEIRKNKLRLPLENVKAIFIENGFTPLFDTYKNANIPLPCICPCGRKTMSLLSSVKEGKRCRGCMGERLSEVFRHDYESVYNFFQQENCVLLSKTYENGRQKLDYICSCGNKAKISFEKFKTGQRCQSCKATKISEKTKGVPRPNWSGENHPMWKPDRTDEERLADRKFQEYHQWRKLVFEKDGFTCLSCGQVGKSLNAHHKDGWNWCIERRLDVDNGATLCSTCHNDFHKEYGKGNNTCQQFEEFLKAN